MKSLWDNIKYAVKVFLDDPWGTIKDPQRSVLEHDIQDKLDSGMSEAEIYDLAKGNSIDQVIEGFAVGLKQTGKLLNFVIRNIGVFIVLGLIVLSLYFFIRVKEVT